MFHLFRLHLVFICSCLATKSHAEIIANSNTTTPSPTSDDFDDFSSLKAMLNDLKKDVEEFQKLFPTPPPSPLPADIENELAKINSTCFTSRDYELLTGDTLKYGAAKMRSRDLLSKSSMSIGLAELRRSLNFGPLRPWTQYNCTCPSEEELASAPSIEAYYDLIEPIPFGLTLSNQYTFEKNIVDAVAYLDKRVPSFRTIYRRRFEEMHQLNNGLIDRESIKRMTDELDNIGRKIGEAIGNIVWINNC